NSGSCISSIPRIALIAQGHEHDIHNARLSTPVYAGPKFNSLLDNGFRSFRGEMSGGYGSGRAMTQGVRC
ncbi:hypothetical protein, partial [Burkholderia sp. MSMB1552]|uniref:hypothetical protein n=1 Tax=Burkholderia sp. MSMB1552 TaxID=1636424 RepID=UPI001E2C1E7E